MYLTNPIHLLQIEILMYHSTITAVVYISSVKLTVNYYTYKVCIQVRLNMYFCFSVRKCENLLEIHTLFVGEKITIKHV